ncbi:MAG TPA: hypothetical protein VHJ18_22935 [Streptosporangiaceae bacterium]|jgi:hypothetical protein|nr:hypothetical protein [Streptosporangiaceae bacterium]
MPEEKDAGLPGRARLPGFDEQSDRGQYRDGYGPYGPPVPASGYPPRDYARDRGVRSSRLTSTWTAAALIAAVAATTGYLAHSMPSTSAGTGYTTTKPSGHAGVVKHGAPSVNGPVVTSGGSGAVGAGRSGGGSPGGWSDN